jgi:NADPH-dependent ferric siderophore reductase
MFGDLTVTADVTETMMRDKIHGITLFGDATAPPGLVGVLQVLTSDAFGSIRASNGPGS